MYPFNQISVACRNFQPNMAWLIYIPIMAHLYIQLPIGMNVPFQPQFLLQGKNAHFVHFAECMYPFNQIWNRFLAEISFVLWRRNASRKQVISREEKRWWRGKWKDLQAMVCAFWYAVPWSEGLVFNAEMQDSLTWWLIWQAAIGEKEKPEQWKRYILGPFQTWISDSYLIAICKDSEVNRSGVVPQ